MKPETPDMWLHPFACECAYCERERLPEPKPLDAGTLLKYTALGLWAEFIIISVIEPGPTLAAIGALVGWQ